MGMDFRGLVWKRVRIWRTERHTPAKNSQEYPPRATRAKLLSDSCSSGFWVKNINSNGKFSQNYLLHSNESCYVQYCTASFFCLYIVTVLISLTTTTLFFPQYNDNLGRSSLYLRLYPEVPMYDVFKFIFISVSPEYMYSQLANTWK